MKLGAKIIILIFTLIIVIVSSIIVIVRVNMSNLIEKLTADQAQSANQAFANTIDDYLYQAKSRANMIAASEEIVGSILANDTEALREKLINMSEGVDLITLCDKNGIALARSHNEKFGDDVTNQKTLSVALATGEGVNAIEEGTVIGLSTRGSAAIFDSQGNIIGAVTCGHDLSKPEYVDKIKEQSDCETTLFAWDERMNTTITDENGNRVIGTKASDQVVETVLKNGKTFLNRIDLFGLTYSVCYTPLKVDDTTVGMIFSGVNIEDTLKRESSIIMMIIIISAVISLAAIAGIIIMINRMILIPMKKIGDFAKRMEMGDVGVSSNGFIDVKSKDETGELARVLENTCKALKGYVSEIRTRMSDFASGNYTNETNYGFNGDFIVIKDSINNICHSFNDTMGVISHVAEQTASGSKQCTEGAQLLAEGSVKQASSVEELSEAVAEISRNTAKGAETAKKAAELSKIIKGNAEKGDDQMKHMVNAVNEINEASQGISKVIKVIDDIAFQTNILALNAAVEAARAGQMGKGFAVVADEVRNLAAKSADAVKDTGKLITNSIEKTKLGVEIADETAHSISEIISGINESAVLVNNIADAYAEQNEAVNQINSNIERVAQIVQQNSSTAQESAAASEELNDQSTELKRMVEQFKLKER